MSATPYVARFDLPDLLERGKPQTLELRLELEGVPVVPDSVQVRVYDRGRIARVDGVGTPGATSSYEVEPGTLASLPFGDGWRVEWSAVINGRTYSFWNDAALVRHRLYPVISDRDLYARVSRLDPASVKPLTTFTTYEPYRAGAWRQIQLRLIARGKRPWLVLSPSALAEAHLALTLALLFEDLSTRLSEAHAERAASYREQFERTWREVGFAYDMRDSAGMNVRTGTTGPIILQSRR